MIDANLPSTARSPHQDLQYLGPKSRWLFQLPREFFLPTVFSTISSSRIGRSGLVISRGLQHCPCVINHRNPDPRWSTVNTSGYRHSRCRVFVFRNPKYRGADATCYTPHSLCGTRCNSGLRCSSVFPSTLKTPKCRIPTPRDLVPPVPPTIDDSD